MTAKLYADGRIGRDEVTVSCITGNGLKTTDAIAGQFQQERAIRPRLADFVAHLEELDHAGVGAELAMAGGGYVD